jgi:hypothetical protein
MVETRELEREIGSDTVIISKMLSKKIILKKY